MVVTKIKIFKKMENTNNNNIKKFFTFIFVLMNISFISAGTLIYDNINNQSFTMDVFNVGSITSPNYDTQNFISSKDLGINSVNLSVNYSYTTTVYPHYLQTIKYSNETEDFVLMSHVVTTFNTNQDYNFSFNKYLTLSGNSMLESNICNVNSLSFNESNGVLSVSSNLLPWKVYFYNTTNLSWMLDEANISTELETHFENLFEKYYYMKSTVKADLYKNGTYIETYLPFENIDESGLGTVYNNYSLLSPQNTNLTFDDFDLRLKKFSIL